MMLVLLLEFGRRKTRSGAAGSRSQRGRGVSASARMIVQLTTCTPLRGAASAVFLGRRQRAEPALAAGSLFVQTRRQFDVCRKLF